MGELYAFLGLVVTQVCAVITLYLQGRTQHAANDARLAALEDGVKAIREALGMEE